MRDAGASQRWSVTIKSPGKSGAAQRLRILFIGDIFGRPGRTIVRDHVRKLITQYNVDLTIANGENAAGGFGITPQIAEELSTWA